MGDPVTQGWKLGQLGEDSGNVHLRSALYGVRVDIEDRALCFEHLEHDPPTRDCTCGFVATSAPASLIVRARPPFSQLWHVELSGRILHGHDTYRGEVQRVRSLFLPPVCAWCGQKATVLCAVSGARPPREDKTLVPSCPNCSATTWWSPAQIGEGLGVDVQWASLDQTIILLGLANYH